MISGVKKITGTGSAKAISNGRLQYGNRIGGRVTSPAFSPTFQEFMFSMGCVDLRGNINPNFIGNAEAFCQSKPPEIGLKLQEAILPVLDILTQMEDLKAEDNYFIDALRLGDNRSVTLTACFARAILASIPAFLTITGIVSGVLPVLGASIALGLAVVSLVRDFKARKQIQQNIEEFIKSQNPIATGALPETPETISIQPQHQSDELGFFATAVNPDNQQKRDLDGPEAFKTAIIPAAVKPLKSQSVKSTADEQNQENFLDYSLSWITIKCFNLKESIPFFEITSPQPSQKLTSQRTRLFLTRFREEIRKLVLTVPVLYSGKIAEKARNIWDEIIKIDPAWVERETRQIGSKSDAEKIITQAMLYFQKGINKKQEELESSALFILFGCFWGEDIPLNILYQAACLPDKDIARKALSTIEKLFPRMTEEEQTDCARVIASLLIGTEVGDFGLGFDFSFSLLPEIKKEANERIMDVRNWRPFALKVRQESKLLFESTLEIPSMGW